MMLLSLFIGLEIWVAIVCYWTGYRNGHNDGWAYRRNKMRGGK